MLPAKIPNINLHMPTVSIIIPCFNEEKTIRLLLEAIYEQTFPRADMEVVIADGLSTDNTRNVIQNFQVSHPDLAIKLIDNPKRFIPAGLNRAIEAADGDIVVRLDAHSVPSPTYVARSVQALEDKKGANIGGVWKIKPGGSDWLAKSIAVAASLPLGVGDALYRVGGEPQEVDTVPFGAFYKSLVDEIGLFDENLLSNEDYEFNVRIRKSGKKIWLDPSIESQYFSRSTIPALIKQYWRYGYWKYKMLKRYPDTLRWRQGLPPLFVLSLILLSGLSFFRIEIAWLLLLEVSIYLILLVSAGMYAAYKKRIGYLSIGLPVSIASMHVSWGLAFLLSLLDSVWMKWRSKGS